MSLDPGQTKFSTPPRAVQLDAIPPTRCLGDVAVDLERSASAVVHPNSPDVPAATFHEGCEGLMVFLAYLFA